MKARQAMKVDGEKMKQDAVLLQHAVLLRELAVTMREFAAHAMDIATRLIKLEQQVDGLLARYKYFTVGRNDGYQFRLNNGTVVLSVSGFPTAEEASKWLGRLEGPQKTAVARGEFYIDGPMEGDLWPAKNGLAKRISS